MSPKCVNAKQIKHLKKRFLSEYREVYQLSLLFWQYDLLELY